MIALNTESLTKLCVVCVTMTSVAAIVRIGYRIIWNVWVIRRRRQKLVKKREEKPSDNVREAVGGVRLASYMVVLGSGGHTTEMLSLVSELFETICFKKNEEPIVTYVCGSTDHHSILKAKSVLTTPNTDGRSLRNVSFATLPRAREVGQSWISSISTSLHTFLWAFQLVYKTRPHVVLANGPGTSAIVAAVAFLLRVIFPSAFGNRCRVVYIESFARIETLSLSGKLVYIFADRFLVQWKSLSNTWPLAEYYGRLS